MTHNPNAAMSGGHRKHLIEAVIKEVDSQKTGKSKILCFDAIVMAVRKYQKDSGGKK